MLACGVPDRYRYRECTRLVYSPLPVTFPPTSHSSNSPTTRGRGLSFTSHPPVHLNNPIAVLNLRRSVRRQVITSTDPCRAWAVVADRASEPTGGCVTRHYYSLPPPPQHIQTNPTSSFHFITVRLTLDDSALLCPLSHLACLVVSPLFSSSVICALSPHPLSHCTHTRRPETRLPLHNSASLLTIHKGETPHLTRPR